MKIVVTGLRGIPQIMGGIETHCEALYPRLKALRAADEIIVFGRSPYLPPQPLVHEGVEVRPLWTVRNKYLETIIHTALSMVAARFSVKADLLHVHGIGPAVLSPVARLLGCRVVVTHHGADYDRAKWNGFAKWVLRTGERMAVGSADRVIVVSQGMTEILRARYPRAAARIAYIPNGASLPAPATASDPTALAAALAPFGVTPGGYVLAVARLVPEKGLHDLVAAFEQLAPNGLRLLIAGAADHHDDYARGLLARASDRVIFAGFQPRTTVAALYRGAALFVMPSYHEGLPIAALEAAAAGTPILLSDIRPNRDLGLDAHNYFPVGQVAALAERLTRDPGAYRYDQAAILARFNWDDVAARTDAIYRSVLDQRH